MVKDETEFICFVPNGLLYEVLNYLNKLSIGKMLKFFMIPNFDR